ncbi:unnamed protein product [Caenorhabditis brenneri]
MSGGWIHAVYTSKDCIAITGGFYERTNIAMQIRINQLDEDTKKKTKTIVRRILLKFIETFSNQDCFLLSKVNTLTLVLFCLH